MEQSLSATIDKDYGDNTALDFAWLRHRAIELVQQYSGKGWTDYNLHDPGVTILEMVCFALTDLAYRTSMPIADLLAAENGRINYATNSFFTREQILTSAPVSITDFRRWITDSIYEVNNIWFEPIVSPYSKTYSRGRYRVIIQLYEKWQQQLRPGRDAFDQTQQVIEKVKQMLAEGRNMGEDFEEFIVMQPQPVTICAEIMLFKKAVPEEILAQIYYRLEKALNPPMLFYTEKEMLDHGYRYEQIYEGPLLQGGIVPEEELRRMKTTADPAELIKAISGMEDILHIRKLEIAAEGAAYEVKPLVLQKYHYPLLVFNPERPDIRLYYDEQPLPLNGAVFESLLLRLREGMQREFVEKIHDEKSGDIIDGEWRNTEAYTSLQHFFPAIYRLGQDAMEEQETPERKARVKQLKAYLMLFEQVIAGYLSQLSHVNELFSYETTNARSYFFQPLYQVPGAADIIKAFTDEGKGNWEAFTADPENAYVAALGTIAETDEIYRQRKNRSLEHVLSRFNIIPDKYPVMLYNLYYGSRAKKERVDEELKWKSLLLQNAMLMNNYRTRAENYKQYGVDCVSPGFAHNMKLLLHLKQRGGYSATKVIQEFMGARENRHKPQLAYYKTYEEGEEVVEVWVDENMPLDGGFYMNHVPVSFLQVGTDPGKYRLLAHPVYADEYLVAMRRGDSREWQAISRYSSRAKAAAALRVFVERLQQFSIASEGFHIVEHLLLAPSHGNNVFCFELQDEKGLLLLRHRKWLAWQEREEAVAHLLHSMTEAHSVTSWLETVQLHCRLYMPHTPDGKPEEVAAVQQLTSEQRGILAGKLRYTLQEYRNRKTNFYPRFRYEVQRADGGVISEDFYNAVVTIVFPAWPARFQDKGFRAFAESLFMNHLPAHMQPVFLWMGVAKMKQFEQLHQTWSLALKNQKDSVSHAHAERLASFLLQEHKYTLL